MDNVKAVKEKHYYVFVSFLDKINDPSVLPEVYVVPSADLPALTYKALKAIEDAQPKSGSQ